MNFGELILKKNIMKNVWFCFVHLLFTSCLFKGTCFNMYSSKKEEGCDNTQMELFFNNEMKLVI